MYTCYIEYKIKSYIYDIEIYYISQVFFKINMHVTLKTEINDSLQYKLYIPHFALLNNIYIMSVHTVSLISLNGYIALP